MEPMTTDQKYAGLSRAAQRQYLRGVAQKRGELDMATRASRGRVSGGLFLRYAGPMSVYWGGALLENDTKHWT